MMKKMFILSISVNLLLGCIHQDDSFEKKITVVNNSSYTIEIVSYIPPNNTEQYQTRLNFLPGIMYSRKFKGNKSNYDSFNFEYYLTDGIFGVNTVDIIFNNTKKVTYQNCTVPGNCLNPRNIFNPFDDGLDHEIYVITNEDYDNAIDCGGNCN